MLSLKKNPYRKIAILNSCIIAFFYFDLFNPIDKQIPEKFASFEEYRKVGADYRGGETYENVYRLECKSGNSYRFIFKPSFGSAKINENVTIEKTFVLSKLSKVKIGNKIYNISFLTNINIILCSLFCLTIALYYIFKPNQSIETILGFTTPFLYVGSLIYLIFG